MSFSLIASIMLALLLAGVLFVILADDRDSGSKMLWIVTIALLPVVGLLLYFLFGVNYRHHKYYDRKHKPYTDIFSREADDRVKKLLFDEEKTELVRERYRPLVRLLEGRVRTGLSSGNDVEIITSGPRKLEALLEDIRQARHFIHIEYYLFGSDEGGTAVRAALMQKAREGVEVRFLHENIANYDTSRSFYNEMRKAGVEIVRVFNPRFRLLHLITRLNYRNHRKIVVIDGRIGYTGGMNIKDRYFKKWRDTHLRISGDAVASLQHIFLDSWIVSGGKLRHEIPYYFPPVTKAPGAQGVLHDVLMQVTPDEPASKWPILMMSYIWAIQHAEKYIWLQTPYFIPPPSVLDALKAAALSGVEVRVMVPAESENFFTGPAVKSFYKECLEAGIRIFERGGGFIHAKTFVSDDYLCSVGTANIDARSFEINYEVNTYIYDTAAALRCKRIFEEDLGISREIMLEDWKKTPLGRRLAQNLVRLFSTQL